MTKETLQASARSAIEHFMTRNPHCIGRTQTLASAHQRMRTSKIRHLPVLEGGKIVGILSQRDLFFVETLRDTSADSTLVEEAMTSEVYVVPQDRTLGEVAAKMVEQKFGCAVVARDGHIVGIFTTSDALRVLSGMIAAWL